MKLRYNLFITIIIFCLLILTAEAQPAVKVEDASADCGKTTTVNITALNVSDLANFDVTVSYNKSLLEVIDSNNNPVFGNQINNLEHSSNGWVRIASLNTGNGRSGDVLLSTLTLKALCGREVGTSYLNITVNSFFNSSEGNIPVSTDNSTFTAPQISEDKTDSEIGKAGSITGGGRLRFIPTTTPTATTTEEISTPAPTPSTSSPEESPTPSPTTTSIITPKPTPITTPVPFWQHPTVTIALLAIVVAAIAILMYMIVSK